jgi:hypothetical protein
MLGFRKPKLEGSKTQLASGENKVGFANASWDFGSPHRNLAKPGLKPAKASLVSGNPNERTPTPRSFTCDPIQGMENPSFTLRIPDWISANSGQDPIKARLVVLDPNQDSRNPSWHSANSSLNLVNPGWNLLNPDLNPVEARLCDDLFHLFS